MCTTSELAVEATKKPLLRRNYCYAEYCHAFCPFSALVMIFNYLPVLSAYKLTPSKIPSMQSVEHLAKFQLI